jgi:hypothetical protein
MTFPMLDILRLLAWNFSRGVENGVDYDTRQGK